MLRRNPAVLWYWDDFLGGTSHMTDEEVGAYVRCLGQQWADGGTTTIERLKRVLRGRFDEVWPSIEDKFQVDENRCWNIRLKNEIKKRRNFCESRSNNRKSSSNSKKNQPLAKQHMSVMCNSHDEHMGNGNGNNIRGGVGEISKPKKKSENQLPIPEIEPLKSAVAGFVESRRKTVKKPLTARALELALKKLEKWCPGDIDKQAAIIDYAVEHGWQGVYWPKEWGPEPSDQYAQQALDMNPKPSYHQEFPR